MKRRRLSQRIMRILGLQQHIMGQIKIFDSITPGDDLNKVRHKLWTNTSLSDVQLFEIIGVINIITQFHKRLIIHVDVHQAEFGDVASLIKNFY